MATRINKYLSEVGYCSRRRADKLIKDGKVIINGKIPEIGTKVEDDDEVVVEGQRIEKSKKQKNIYLAFNKPVGIGCTTDRRVEPDNIIDFIKYPKRIFPIGRLDKHSKGLIFLTNDGDIVNKILRARNNPVAAEPHTFSGPLLPPLFSDIPFSFLNLKPILVTRDPNIK